VSQSGHDDIAARLRREASAAAPDRLRADVMVRVRAEPRPQRIRPRRSLGRSFATVAAAACILGALVVGASHVDFGGSSSSSGGGGSAAAGQTRAHAPLGVGGEKSTSPSRAAGQQDALTQRRVTLAVPTPLRAAIYGRFQLAAPLRHTFGALDPYHMRTRP
jgi:hypothetical protein